MEGWVAAILTGLGTLVVAVVGAVIAYMNARHKNRQEEEDTALTRCSQIIDRLEKQIARLEGHAEEQQGVIQELYEDYGASQIEVSDLYGWLQRMRDICCRLAEEKERAGRGKFEVPALPPRKPRRQARAEFVARTTRQNTALSKEIDSRIIPPGGSVS